MEKTVCTHSTGGLCCLSLIHCAVNSTLYDTRRTLDGIQLTLCVLEGVAQSLLDTEEGIRDIAEQELGLVDPDTVILVPQQ